MVPLPSSMCSLVGLRPTRIVRVTRMPSLASRRRTLWRPGASGTVTGERPTTLPFTEDVDGGIDGQRERGHRRSGGLHRRPRGASSASGASAGTAAATGLSASPTAGGERRRPGGAGADVGAAATGCGAGATHDLRLTGEEVDGGQQDRDAQGTQADVEHRPRAARGAWLGRPVRRRPQARGRGRGHGRRTRGSIRRRRPFPRQEPRRAVARDAGWSSPRSGASTRSVGISPT